MSWLSDLSSFTIHLERENGIYIAGETIRGLIHLSTNCPLECCGITVKLSGYANCNWGEVRRLDRVESEEEFVGERLYCSRTLTVYGRVYNTELLYENGSNLVFDVEDGTGDMTIFIPSELSMHDINLAVRVIEQHGDKGSQHVLGAAVVSLPDLLQFPGTSRSFALYRGEKLDSFGNIVLSATLAEPCLKLLCEGVFGLQRYNSENNTGVFVQAYFVDLEELEGNVPPGPNDEFVFPGKEKIFPFWLTIPQRRMPSSFSSIVKDFARVQYSLYSKVRTRSGTDPSTRKFITVLSSELPRPIFLVPQMRAVHGDKMLYTRKCCLKYPLGAINFTAGLNTAYLSPGDNFFASFCVYNGTSKLSSTLSIKLRMRWRLSNGRGRSRCDSRIIPLYSEEIPPLKVLTRYTRDPVSLVCPLMPPSFSMGRSGGPGSKWQRGDPITWTYSIVMQLDMDRKSDVNLIWEVPVFVGIYPMSILNSIPQYVQFFKPAKKKKKKKKKEQKRHIARSKRKERKARSWEREDSGSEEEVVFVSDTTSLEVTSKFPRDQEMESLLSEEGEPLPEPMASRIAFFKTVGDDEAVKIYPDDTQEDAYNFGESIEGFLPSYLVSESPAGFGEHVKMPPMLVAAALGGVTRQPLGQTSIGGAAGGGGSGTIRAHSSTGVYASDNEASGKGNYNANTEGEELLAKPRRKRKSRKSRNNSVIEPDSPLVRRPVTHTIATSTTKGISPTGSGSNSDKEIISSTNPNSVIEPDSPLVRRPVTAAIATSTTNGISHACSGSNSDKEIISSSATEPDSPLVRTVTDSNSSFLRSTAAADAIIPPPTATLPPITINCFNVGSYAERDTEMISLSAIEPDSPLMRGATEPGSPSLHRSAVSATNIIGSARVGIHSKTDSEILNSTSIEPDSPLVRRANELETTTARSPFATTTTSYLSPARAGSEIDTYIEVTKSTPTEPGSPLERRHSAATDITALIHSDDSVDSKVVEPTTMDLPSTSTPRLLATSETSGSPQNSRANLSDIVPVIEAPSDSTDKQGEGT